MSMNQKTKSDTAIVIFQIFDRTKKNEIRRLCLLEPLGEAAGVECIELEGDGVF